jgi:hypothetical protein
MNDANVFQTERREITFFFSFFLFEMTLQVKSIVPNSPIGTLAGRYEKKKNSQKQNETVVCDLLWKARLTDKRSGELAGGGEKRKKEFPAQRHKEVSFFQSKPQTLPPMRANNCTCCLLQLGKEPSKFRTEEKMLTFNAIWEWAKGIAPVGLVFPAISFAL